MKLRLERTWCGAVCTIGTLSIDGAFECFTLEDVVRERDGEPVEAWKIYGETAIPRGRYPVTITYSNRFKRDLPLVDRVPGFAGIRIHPGNTHEDTEGCILVGRAKGPDRVLESRAAFLDLYDKLDQALARGEAVTLEVA
jgi:hypothetical protein